MCGYAWLFLSKTRPLLAQICTFIVQLGHFLKTMPTTNISSEFAKSIKARALEQLTVFLNHLIGNNTP